MICSSWTFVSGITGLFIIERYGSKIPVTAIHNALREGEAAAEEQDVLIATEAMQVREELEELLRVHGFDNWQERCQRAVVGQNLTLAVGDVHAGAWEVETLTVRSQRSNLRLEAYVR